MKKDKTNKKSNSDGTKTNEWFIENGYTDPMEIIDHNGDLDVPEAFIQIFVAYNQHNIAEGKAWDTWPDWELVLTSMRGELQVEDPENDTPEILAERQHWLSLMEFMYDSDAVTIDGYTIIIEGLHGHQFTFDMCLEHEIWISPRSLVRIYEKINNNTTQIPGLHVKSNAMKFYPRFEVEHSLEAFWECPEHVPNYGGKSTSYTHDNRFCIEQQEGEQFPLAMLSLIQLCLDDTEIWSMMFEQDIADIEHHEFMEREWPMGRPDQDWEYQ